MPVYKPLPPSPHLKILLPKIDALFYLMDITNGNKTAVEKYLFSFIEKIKT
tara:strand:- start:376 stop:528 length:153 start_codon:yes stop_codon:yes gene_type:complete